MVLKLSAPKPKAVFPLPLVLATSAFSPLAVLLWPIVLAASAARPVAVLPLPVVLREERPSTDGRVLAACGVAKQGLIAVAGIREAGGVAEEGERSIGCVAEADRVAEKRSGPNGRVTDCLVRKECPSADRRVEAAGNVAIEREEANCRIELADREIMQGVVTLCCVASGIASIRRRSNRSRRLRKRKRCQHQCDEKNTAPQSGVINRIS